MRRFADVHPLVQAGYFLLLLGVPMCSVQPLLSGIALLGGLFYAAMQENRKPLTGFLRMLWMFPVLILINPLFVHRGSTILFFLNDRPVTLEALCYGISMALMIFAVLLWCRMLTVCMTSDRLLYLLGRVSPKLSLILSTILRYIPRFRQQAHNIRQAQTAMGLYARDNLPDKLRGSVRVFSVLITWTLEHGIETADAMRARGYGTGRRTSFSLFRFTRRDAVLTLLLLCLIGAALWGMLRGGLTIQYYPVVAKINYGNPETWLPYAAYTLAALLPGFLDGKERLQWHFCKLKI